VCTLGAEVKKLLDSRSLASDELVKKTTKLQNRKTDFEAVSYKHSETHGAVENAAIARSMHAPKFFIFHFRVLDLSVVLLHKER
jgi:ribosomal protein L9